jgi:zinc and cadmium transporter
LIAAIPMLIKKKVSDKVLLFFLSMSVGVLLSTVFIDFLPEIASNGYTLGVSLNILLGFLVFFILEKLVHWHHNKNHKDDEHVHGHGHAYHLASVNLIGDGVHNFLDGLVIAGAYSVNIVLGITATISVIFHEIPQEIADFGVLLYSGMSKKRALTFNFMSAIMAVIGVIIGLLLVNKIEGFERFIIPFAAGNFIYIAASNLLPQLHRHCKLTDTLIHISAIILGIGIIVLVTLLSPGHM